MVTIWAPFFTSIINNSFTFTAFILVVSVIIINEKIICCKKHDLDIARYMNVIPVSFSSSAKDMLLHTKELLEHERPLVAIHPKHDKLITALRTCISDDLGKVNKEQTSYDDLLDAFRLALKGINLVKKDIRK